MEVSSSRKRWLVSGRRKVSRGSVVRARLEILMDSHLNRNLMPMHRGRGPLYAARMEGQTNGSKCVCHPSNGYGGSSSGLPHGQPRSRMGMQRMGAQTRHPWPHVCGRDSSYIHSLTPHFISLFYRYPFRFIFIEFNMPTLCNLWLIKILIIKLWQMKFLNERKM